MYEEQLEEGPQAGQLVRLDVALQGEPLVHPVHTRHPHWGSLERPLVITRLPQQGEDHALWAAQCMSAQLLVHQLLQTSGDIPLTVNTNHHPLTP